MRLGYPTKEERLGHPIAMKRSHLYLSISKVKYIPKIKQLKLKLNSNSYFRHQG